MKRLFTLATVFFAFCITAYSQVIPDNIISADCYGNVSPSAWSVNEAWRSTQEVCALITPVVGDLDGDGIPEIVAAGPRVGNTKYFNKLYIFKGENRNSVKTINTGNVGFRNLGAFAIGKTTIDGEEKAIIVVALASGKLQAWDPNGSLTVPLWTSTANFVSGTSAIDMFTSVHFADFDGDGVPEIYTSDRIFDSSTGKLLVSKTGGGSRGEVSMWAYRSAKHYFSHVADVMGEGKPQLILANEVYRVNIVSKTDPTQNSLALASSILPFALPGVEKLDGVSLAVDINQDGLLDVLVVSSGDDTHLKVGLYAWDPRTQNVIAQTVFTDVSPQSSTLSQAGVPFVGDVDGDGKLEVLMVNSDKIHGFRIFNDMFLEVYNMPVNDPSGTTGITLFDFNQDGTAELVYRDEQNLRIMRANPFFQNFSTLQSYPCGSATIWEYPLVADVDNDGSAEIVAIGGGSAAYDGTLRIYKSGNASSPWAPARRVWNQYAYNVVNVNEDLTIPKIQYNSATPFSGGVCNSATPTQPFNGFLQQATTLNQYGCPFWLLPDIVFDGPVNYTVYPDGDSLVIQLTLKNQGDAAAQAPFYISVYKNSVSIPNLVHTHAHPNPIGKGESATIKFTIYNLSAFSPFSSLIVKFNDNGTGISFQPECDSTYNNVPIDVKMGMGCADDYATTGTNHPVTIDVPLNDSYPGCNRPDITISITSVPAHGTATVNANKDIVYTPITGWYGIDSLRYLLTDCHAEKDSAMAYIATLKPGALMYVACPNATTTLSLHDIPGVKYYWYTAQTEGILVSGGSNASSLTVTKNASAQETWWVEARYGSIIFPRYRIDLFLSESCGGTQTACASTGSLLFREDFGGNLSSDPVYKPTGIPQVTGYNYVTTTSSSDGVYWIRKQSIDHSGLWYIFDDHTYPQDVTRGYLLQVNASQAPGQFYEQTIEGLCEGGKLTFTAWISSVVLDAFGVDKTNMVFLLEDTHEETIAQYYTGDVPDMDPAWKQYGFEFTVPQGINSLKLRIINNGTGSVGNDFVMDDIEVRLCTPPVTATVNGLTSDTICAGDGVNLTASYTDNGTFPGGLVGYWLKSTTGNINDPSEWTRISSSDVTGGGSISSSISDNPAGTTIYYRFVTANSANINNPMCRAASDVLSVYFRPVPSFTIQHAATCSEPINLYACVLDLKDALPDSLKFSTEDTFTSGLISNPSSYVFTGITTIYVKASNGCTSAVQEITITAGALWVVIPTDSVKNVSCYGGSDGSALARPLNGTSPYTYLWNTTPPQTDSLAMGLAKGTYSCTVADAVGCVGTTDNIILTEPDQITVDSIKAANTFCNEPYGRCQVFLKGGTSPYSFTYDGGTTWDTSNPKTALMPGDYLVMAKDSLDCLTGTYPFTIADSPLQVSIAASDTVCKTQNMVLSPGVIPLSYLWQDGSTSQTCPVSDIGWYWVKVFQSPTCQAVDSVYVENCNLIDFLFFPSAFSPNGDGLNDVFILILNPKIADQVPEDHFAMQVYDKWGGLVFQTKNPKIGWDGTNSGQKCPVGVYTYLVKYLDPLENKAKTLRGSVLLLE